MKMVQRKVSNKLAIQANDLLKTEKRQANIKPSIQTHDGKSKAPDLRIKKMKKSRPIKRADLEISVRSPPTPHQAPRQPGKPPPLGPPACTPSPKKASPSSPRKSSSYGSPNYMKSTSSSEARKEQAKVSASSSLKLHRVVKTFTKTSSLKKVRTLTKAPSFKHTRTGVNKCSKVVLRDNLDVKRNTCSSTLKDSKFPPYVELSPGATEAEGTSTMKVCPYNYCSLNGHHHKPAPPLRCFLSSRRKLLKTQKVAKPEALSPRKARVLMPEVDQTEDFFIEICIPGKDAIAANEDGAQVSEIFSEKPSSNTEDTVSSHVDFSREARPTTALQDQTSSEFSYCNETEEVDNSATVSLNEFFSETLDMEWEEGRSNVSVEDDDGCNQDKPEHKSDDNERGYFEEFVAGKLKSYFGEDIMECDCFSDAGSVPDSESTQSDEEQIEGPFKVQEEGNIDSEQKDKISDEEPISANPDFQSIEDENSFFSQCIDEITEAGNEGLDVNQESAETNDCEAVQDNYTGRDIKEENNDVMNETISTENTTQGTEEAAPMASNDSQVEVNQSDAGNERGFNAEKNKNEANESLITGTTSSKEQNEDRVATVEEPEMEEINKTEERETFTIVKDEPHPNKGMKFSSGGADASQELLNGCNKLKRSIRCKKENEDTEELGEFNPRGPNFLPLEPDPEAEKVDLRHQEIDERRNAEEWMLDYALRKTVNQLAPARKRKVALLVEAFESVMPIPKCEPHLTRNSSGFAHARPIQACS